MLMLQKPMTLSSQTRLKAYTLKEGARSLDHNFSPEANNLPPGTWAGDSPIRGYADDSGNLIVMFGHSKGCILDLNGDNGSVWRFDIRNGKWSQLKNYVTKKAGPFITATLGATGDKESLVTIDDAEGVTAAVQLCGHQLVYDKRREIGLLVGGRVAVESSTVDNDFKLFRVKR